MTKPFRTAAERVPPQAARLAALLAALWIGAALWPDALAGGAFDRTAIAQGEWWRLLTGHLVHLGGVHLALNLLGLWLIVELLWRGTGAWTAGIALLCAAAAVDAGLWWRHADLQWYAGASGVLHGLWACCALDRCWPQRGTEDGVAGSIGVGWIGGLLLLAKLAGEAWLGPEPSMEQWIGGPVIDAAHRDGAVGGALGWAACRSISGWSRLHRRTDLD